MTDRELLELAAKAAGIPITPDCHIPSGGIWMFHVDVDRVWSPLTDDGDALRLAVALRIHVSVEHDAAANWWFGDALEQFNEPLGDDEFAATRRAIVRAAAEIGKAMP